jgi:hypothetical protein
MERNYEEHKAGADFQPRIFHRCRWILSAVHRRNTCDLLLLAFIRSYCVTRRTSHAQRPSWLPLVSLIFARYRK